MMAGPDTIGEYRIPHKFKKGIADHLIAHGVTVQEWVPVTERLPDNKEHDWVLAQVVEDNGFMHIPKVMEYRQQRNDWFEETYGWLSDHNGAFIVTTGCRCLNRRKENDYAETLRKLCKSQKGNKCVFRGVRKMCFCGS
jgi:hypothetical protein